MKSCPGFKPVELSSELDINLIVCLPDDDDDVDDDDNLSASLMPAMSSKVTLTVTEAGRTLLTLFSQVSPTYILY